MRSGARILFVCLGNICRSPLAEGAMRAAAGEAGLDVAVDSAGTGDWHVGKSPDPRAVAVAKSKGVDISGLRARQVSAQDFDDYSHIFALDAQNLADLQKLQPDGSRAKLCLLMDIVPGREGQAVADPYYGDESGFETTWAEVSEAAEELVARLSR